jgi:hypothetical protein
MTGLHTSLSTPSSDTIVEEAIRGVCSIRNTFSFPVKISGQARGRAGAPLAEGGRVGISAHPLPKNARRYDGFSHPHFIHGKCNLRLPLLGSEDVGGSGGLAAHQLRFLSER